MPTATILQVLDYNISDYSKSSIKLNTFLVYLNSSNTPRKLVLLLFPVYRWQLVIRENLVDKVAQVKN